jgi:hypothetical protein
LVVEVRTRIEMPSAGWKKLPVGEDAAKRVKSKTIESFFKKPALPEKRLAGRPPKKRFTAMSAAPAAASSSEVMRASIEAPSPAQPEDEPSVPKEKKGRVNWS